MIQFDEPIFQMGGSTTNSSKGSAYFWKKNTVTTRNDSHRPQMYKPFFVHVSEGPLPVS